MARKRQPVKLTARISPEPMSADEWRGLERVLARIIAKAYLADHPELLSTGSGRGASGETERDGE